MIHIARRLVPLLTLASAGVLAQVQEPLASQEPSANKEPSANQVPSVNQVPAANGVVEEMVVTASRTARPISAIPNTVTVIDKQALDQQLSIQHDLSTALGNLVPGFTPGRQKMTGAGETLRGRSPLYLIDGVPQSNPLRDGARDGLTLDPAMIERIEVIHGANAVHGMGASGGIINLITKKPTETLEQSVNLDLTMPTDYDSDALAGGLGYNFSNAFGSWDLAFSATARDTGVYTDANGEVIGVDTTQGDTMDSQSRDFFLKTGYRGEGQSLHLMINDFTIEGQGDWVAQAGDVEAGIPTTAIPGEVEGIPATNDVRTVSLDYRAEQILGHSLHAQLFSQDFAATYGGGRFATFQDPVFGNDIYDQSENQSDKLGFKLTLVKEKLAGLPVDLVWGFDALQDETQQLLVQTKRAWVPPTQYENIAPYAQVEFTGIDKLVATAGLRYESSTLEVKDFTTLHSYGSQSVEGGSPSFDETLYNLGFTYALTPQLRIFGNIAEGSSMPDVGRVLRAIDEPNVSIDSFLNLQPIVTDNRELGLAFANQLLALEMSYYQSDSDFGSRLALNPDGIYEVRREKTEIDGVEANAEWFISGDTSLGLAYSYPQGEYDSDDDGRVDTHLDGTNIAPERLNLFWNQQWNDYFDTRLQASNVMDRNFYDAAGDRYASFDGYTLLDLSATWSWGESVLRASLQNLTNEDYVTYYSQVRPSDLRYFKGRGRTLGLSYNLSF